MKAIDPFVAEVILISVVFFLSALIFISLTTIAEEKSKENIKKAEVAKCLSLAKIKIISVTESTIVILNQGNIELFNISIFVNDTKIGSFDKMNILEIKTLNFNRLNNKSVFTTAYCGGIFISSSCEEKESCWID
ncbi:MAG: hypothetical protein RMJ17_03330 [Candidatus Aenigmarchaeota archaeon]|nr:hypothetical protein [Candidatus Aenigmarchaeota archaeon]MDW8149598.1 hypothetical protein [Candidatus Aenigmarchaeota archaeon]